MKTPSRHYCDARCIYAEGAECSCKCNGENHGRGLYMNAQQLQEQMQATGNAFRQGYRLPTLEEHRSKERGRLVSWKTDDGETRTARVQDARTERGSAPARFLATITDTLDLFAAAATAMIEAETPDFICNRYE